MLGEAFLLGLTTGTYCAISCGPVALPFLFAEQPGSIRANARLVAWLLAGRLIAYLAVGFLLGALGSYSLRYIDPPVEHVLIALAYTAVGLVMLASGIRQNFPRLRICGLIGRLERPGRNAVLYGLFAGLAPCPPFFAAATRVFGVQGGLGGALYFLVFFLGTSLFFLPLLGVHWIARRLTALRMVARLTLLLLGAFFLFFLGLPGLL